MKKNILTTWLRIKISVVAIVLLGGLIVAIGARRISMRTTSYEQVAEEATTESGEVTNEEKVDQTETPELPPEPELKPELIIKAINPGYTDENGTRDAGELIELQKITSTPEISLAGYALRYTNGSGKQIIIYEFPEGSKMAGENLLMRLARSPNSDLADVTYTTTLATKAGPLELLYNGEVIDSVCWTGKKGCAKAFDTNKPTTLVRNLEVELFAEDNFVHLEKYETSFNPEKPAIILPVLPDEDDGQGGENTGDGAASGSGGQAHCRGLRFSEIHAYYANDKAEQFVEVYNPTDETIRLDGCVVRYKKKDYGLTGEIGAGGYYAYYPQGFSLTKNPTSSNVLELFDEDGAKVDTMEYYHGQKKSTAYARFYDADGEEMWKLTYALTPGQENIYQEFRTCEAGKVINPLTGNCIKATDTSAGTLKECPEGKYRSPITNRCRNIETEENTLKPCAEGYERNPVTNRCRKVTKTNEGADYALVPKTQAEKSTFIAAGIVGLLVTGGVVYIILQYRRDIVRGARKVGKRLNSIRKDAVAGKIGFHRNKKP